MNQYMLTEENEKAQKSIQKKINAFFSTDGDSTRNEIMNMWCVLFNLHPLLSWLMPELKCIDSAYLLEGRTPFLNTFPAQQRPGDKPWVLYRTQCPDKALDYTGSLRKVRTTTDKKRKLQPNLVFSGMRPLPGFHVLVMNSREKFLRFYKNFYLKTYDLNGKEIQKKRGWKFTYSWFTLMQRKK